MRLLVAFLAGGLFGAGLYVSGMTDTRKVQGWLDLFGDWDPTLAFVLGGAILPMIFAWRISERRVESILGAPLPRPPEVILDRDLILGSALFGVGWGLSGLCPGPSMASLSFGGVQGVVFFAAMVAAMIALPRIRNFWTGSQQAPI